MNKFNIPTHPYNKLWIGIIFGLLIPFVLYAVLLSVSDFIAGSDYAIEKGMILGFRKRTLALLAILGNIIPMQIFYNKRIDNGMRGIVFPTILYSGLWIYWFGHELFTDQES